MSEIHLIDFLDLRRQFTVDIKEAGNQSPSVSTKRKASEDSPASAKRQRLEEVDTTEVILAPTVRPTDKGTRDYRPSQQVAQPSRTPLLDLEDGDIAVVCTTEPDNVQQIMRPPDAGPINYELRRVGGIFLTPSASVLSVQHSALSGSVVAKILTYKGQSSDLIRIAKGWERETRFLSKLHHVSGLHSIPFLLSPSSVCIESWLKLMDLNQIK